MPSSETPIAEYSFNEGSGELAKDGSGHGHDGTLHGAKWTSEGHFAGALSFDGNKAIVTVPSAKELELSRALTLEAWVKPDEANAWSAVFTKETPEFLSYQLHAEAEGESPAGFLFGNEEEEAAVEGTSPIATKAWSYLALTSDGEYMRLYVGGKLVGTSAAVQGRGGKGPLQIGNDLPWEGDGFKGAIDNIRLYNRTLSGAEIEKDESRAVGIKAPTATSEAATGISATEATLKASVNPNGTATTYQFEYGTTTSYGTKAPTSPESAGSGSTAVALSKAISGLKEATTYHFRVLATSEGATSYGEDKTFTTLVLPSATTEAATGVNEHEATLKGSVNPNGTATSYQFEYGSTTSYGTKVPSSPEPIGNGTANINVGQQIKSLENNHVYHYRIVAISGAGTSYGGDRFLRVDFTPPTSKFESNYQDGSTSTYTLTMHTVDPGSQSAGVKQINFLLNGKVVETFEPSCAENQCPTVTEATWEHSFDHHLTGEDHLTVLTVDAASNNSSTTFDLPSQIAQASVYTGNPAEGGTQLAEEWSQPYTHDARLEEGTRTVTRGSSVCPEPEADKWCSYLRTNTAGEFSEVNAQISEPTTISEAGTLSIPHQADFGKTVETGTTSEIVQPWQTLPRGAGTGYEKIVSENEANQAEGQYLEMAGRWTFWVDAATKLPLKASVSEGTTEPRTAYYSYSSANLEAGELSSSFFLLKPPSRQERGCVASGQLGGWTYNEAGFTNPDPRFDSVINTVNGPLVLRPEGAAADGYEPRAILTEDGIELAANSTDEDRLRWEVTESAEQSLEPAGSAVVVVSEAGVPSAVVESSSSDDVEIVDGDPNVEQNRSGDEVVLEPMEGGTTASLHPVQSPDDQLPCITHPILAQAEMVHEEAVAAGVVMQKPESSKSETTQVKIWINPHPALSGVSITDKYGACNGPNPKTVGSDGYVIFGGCPVGKDTTFTVPAEVNANGLIYRVSDPSRTMKPPSYGWTVSFDYRGESPPGEPPAEEQLPEATELRIGLGEYESNGSEAEVSAEEPINIPPQYDCYAAQSRPWRAESAIPNKFRARAEMIFRCNADAFIDSWWFKWHLSRWDQETGQWKHRAAAEPEGRGPAVQNQGPYYIGTECRSLTNLLKEPEKLWRSEGKAWALAERPGGALFGLGPSFGATKGKKLHCE
ncbi:MAG: LamG-like jellyroll fold domain-containing protein [Solirubrobacterales bacterium]